MEEKIAKLERTLRELIQQNKKTTDSNLNTVQKDLLKRIGELEEAAEAWKKEKISMQAEIDALKVEMSSFCREEGEITEAGRENIKKEIEQSISKTIAGTMEAAREGWVEVVKRNIKQEITEEITETAHKGVVTSTLEEEKLRRARRLNIRVTGIKETGASPEEDGRELCKRLGQKEGEPLPFAKIWRGAQPKDATKGKALILQFADEASRTTFMRQRIILRDLPGDPIYFDEDLTWMQREHRRSMMPRITAARKAGKKAFYRDGHAIIDGKIVT